VHNHRKTESSSWHLFEKAMPARFQRIIDRVVDHDEAWFLANPRQHGFARETVPGEFGAAQVSDITVVMRFRGSIVRVAMQGAIAPGAKQMILALASGDEVCMPVVPLSVT